MKPTVTKLMGAEMQNAILAVLESGGKFHARFTDDKKWDVVIIIKRVRKQSKR